jgi:hypothetical protein
MQREPMPEAENYENRKRRQQQRKEPTESSPTSGAPSRFHKQQAATTASDQP